MKRHIATVVVAAPEVAVREWARQLVDASGEYRVVAESGDAVGAITAVLEHRPDVLVLDALMPGDLSAVEAIPALRARSPHTAIVMLGNPGVEAALRIASRLGVVGWIAPGLDAEQVLVALRLAARRLRGVPQPWPVVSPRRRRGRAAPAVDADSMVAPGGLEPPTPGLGNPRSIP